MAFKKPLSNEGQPPIDQNSSNDSVQTMTIDSIAASDETPIQSPPYAPYKLRALTEVNFMQFDENKKLAYSVKFKRGQEVTDPQHVQDILASSQANQFVKIQLGAD